MKCVFCGFPESKVVDSRSIEGATVIRRRRECMSCQRRFTTREVVDAVPILVVKKDRSRQEFDKSKIMKGLMRACEKRPVELKDFEDIVSSVELAVGQMHEKEIESRFIGEMVLKKLKDTDQVAYVRFASVYRDFKDVSSFKEELDALLNSE